MKWLTKNAVLFSVKTCIAAFLALYIALELNLDKPAWSMVSVYVISQLYSASTLSKATYRFLGTVLGGLFIFLVYPFTVTDPILFSLSVSLWVAFCLYLSLHDRTPKGYVFMLAGYSAAIMGFADVDTPLSITYTVISRVEEINVAILCSADPHAGVPGQDAQSAGEQRQQLVRQRKKTLQRVADRRSERTVPGARTHSGADGELSGQCRSIDHPLRV